jgi:hypothetical protein
MKQLLTSVAVTMVMVLALLLILLIFGFIDQGLFTSMALKVTAVMLVLTVASAIIIKLIGADSHHK